MNEKVFNCLERFSWLFVIISQGLCWDFVDYFADLKAAVPFTSFESIFFTRFSACAIFLAYYILCFVLVKKIIWVTIKKVFGRMYIGNVFDRLGYH